MQLKIRPCIKMLPVAKMLSAIQNKRILYKNMVIQGINQFHGTTTQAHLVIVLIEPDIVTILCHAILRCQDSFPFIFFFLVDSLFMILIPNRKVLKAHFKKQCVQSMSSKQSPLMSKIMIQQLQTNQCNKAHRQGMGNMQENVGKIEWVLTTNGNAATVQLQMHFNRHCQRDLA